MCRVSTVQSLNGILDKPGASPIGRHRKGHVRTSDSPYDVVVGRGDHAEKPSGLLSKTSLFQTVFNSLASKYCGAKGKECLV